MARRARNALDPPAPASPADPAGLPAGAGRRLALLGAAGAGVAGRSSLAALRKATVSPEARQEIDRSVQQANALHRRLFEIPVDAHEELDGLYRALGLYDPGHPRAAEQRAALLAMQRLDAGKYHREGRFDFGDAAYLRELSACLQSHLRLGLAQPGFLLYVRTKLGLYNLFHQLGARVDCRGALLLYL